MLRPAQALITYVATPAGFTSSALHWHLKSTVFEMQITFVILDFQQRSKLISQQSH